MESRQALVLSAIVLVAILGLCQVTPVHSQDLPLCRNLRNQFEEDKIRLFRNADGVNFIVDHLCVNNRNRLRRFYSCPKGFTASIPSRDTATSLRDFRTVLDIRALGNELNLPTNGILTCIPPRPTPPPPTLPPVETVAPIPALESCPSGGGNSVNEYIRQDQDKLCRFSCSFQVGVFGTTTRTITRTLFRCCEGEPQLISRALRLYKCP